MRASTMRRAVDFGCALALLGGLNACTAPRIEGTWRAVDMPPESGGVIDAPNGAVTFARDGTYTSYMEYGGEVLTEHGSWDLSRWWTLRLTTSQGRREYDLTLKDDVLKLKGRRLPGGERITGRLERVKKQYTEVE